LDLIDTNVPLYSSTNAAFYENDAGFRNGNRSYENILNTSGSSLKDGETVLDGSDSLSGSEKSKEHAHRPKVI
jgi:ATP-dependent exoDNAse (exonuclease V) alpha subunit